MPLSDTCGAETLETQDCSNQAGAWLSAWTACESMLSGRIDELREELRCAGEQRDSMLKLKRSDRGADTGQHPAPAAGGARSLPTTPIRDMGAVKATREGPPSARRASAASCTPLHASGACTPRSPAVQGEISTEQLMQEGTEMAAAVAGPAFGIVFCAYARLQAGSFCLNRIAKILMRICLRVQRTGTITHRISRNSMHTA